MAARGCAFSLWPSDLFLGIAIGCLRVCRRARSFDFLVGSEICIVTLIGLCTVLCCIVYSFIL